MGDKADAAAVFFQRGVIKALFMRVTVFFHRNYKDLKRAAIIHRIRMGCNWTGTASVPAVPGLVNQDLRFLGPP